MYWKGSVKAKKTKKLKEAWMAGMPDRKAAIYAGMTPEELTEALRMDNRLALQRAACIAEDLAVEVKARNNVRNSIKNESVDSSKWFLERKVPEEFSTKSTVSVQADDFLSIDEKKAELEKLMEKFGGETR